MRSLRVYLTSCEVGEGAWRANEEILGRLYEISDKRHQLVDCPELADLILIGNVREENWGEKILANQLIRRWPSKCFSLSDADQPLYLNRGVYASATCGVAGWRRVRSGCYALYADQYRNPFIENYFYADTSAIEKRWLFSFLGRESSRVRSRLFGLKFNRSDILVVNTTTFNLWDESRNLDKREAQRRYYDDLLASKFSLCPRGSGASSLRLFESIRMGIAPVILSDRWAYPVGPIWKDFSISVKEKHFGEIESIVGEYEKDFEEMGKLSRRAFDHYFSDEVYFNYVVDSCVEIGARQVVPEVIYQRAGPGILIGIKTISRLKKCLRQTLKGKSL